jgi:hypothetical protein
VSIAQEWHRHDPRLPARLSLWPSAIHSVLEPRVLAGVEVCVSVRNEALTSCPVCSMRLVLYPDGRVPWHIRKRALIEGAIGDEIPQKCPAIGRVIESTTGLRTLGDTRS